jgi:glycerophosphoryl diester phosphodiesterase
VRTRRAAVAVSLAGLLAGLVALPVSALLGTTQPAIRASAAVPGQQVASAVAKAGVPRAARVLVIAHRGFSDIAPENTVPAMTAAAAAGADLVECDVQRTADGHLIVVHDTTFARTTDVATVFPGREGDPVGTFTLAQVRQLDAGSWKGPQFVGTRVPTLDELLTAIQPTASGLLLELKDPALYPGYESQVALALASHGFIGSGRVYVHSFDASALAALHHAAPTVPLGLITEDGSGAVPTGQDTWLRTVNPTTGSVTDAGVDSAQVRHLKVFAWPLDPSQSSAAQVERLVDDGVDGIITDNPVLVSHEIVVAGATTT